MAPTREDGAADPQLLRRVRARPHRLRVNERGFVEADPATFGVVHRIFHEYTTEHRVTRPSRWASRRTAYPAAARNTAVFEAARRLAERRSTQSAAASSRGDFVLTGTVVCGHCAGAYVGTTGTSRNGKKVRYYSCSTGRRYSKARCSAPSVPAEELETLVTDTLLATYADSALFAEAIGAHLSRREDTLGPLQQELAAAEAAVTATERKLARYRDDYESERIAGHALAAPPTDADRKALHATLVDRVRTGSVATRKAMFTALVESLEVHALDDIRPVFRLGGPELTKASNSPEVAGQDGERATAGEMFASRASGGAEGIRTPDLLIANETRYQLRHSPRSPANRREQKRYHP